MWDLWENYYSRRQKNGNPTTRSTLSGKYESGRSSRKDPGQRDCDRRRYPDQPGRRRALDDPDPSRHLFGRQGQGDGHGLVGEQPRFLFPCQEPAGTPGGEGQAQETSRPDRNLPGRRGIIAKARRIQNKGGSYLVKLSKEGPCRGEK